MSRHDTNGPDLYSLTARGWCAAMVLTGTSSPHVLDRLRKLVAMLSERATALTRPAVWAILTTTNDIWKR